MVCLVQYLCTSGDAHDAGRKRPLGYLTPLIKPALIPLRRPGSPPLFTVIQKAGAYGRIIKLTTKHGLIKQKSIEVNNRLRSIGVG